MPESELADDLPRVIPVIDVLGGVAVHAIRGRRDEYRPIESALVEGSDPVDLARTLVERHGFQEIYVADLDAILGRGLQQAMLLELGKLPTRFLFDVGVSSRIDLRDKFAGCGRAGVTLVVASEALADVATLEACLDDQEVRPHIALGLDWRRGSFRTARGLGVDDPARWIEAALERGIDAALALDVDRVGSDAGFAWPGGIDRARRFGEFRRRISGGGVRSLEDLQAAKRAGCDAVLVGTALHDGRLDVDELRRASSCD